LAALVVPDLIEIQPEVATNRRQKDKISKTLLFSIGFLFKELLNYRILEF
jgi:hypothetical protein